MALTEGQQRCVETLDRAIVVAAGAGSGKTFTLTKRIVHALKEGYVHDIDQVMAITFTRKAAGELKSRIKAELRANGMVDQALKVDGAWISTIHGMCARILRAHAFELGIDPAFVVAEGLDLFRMQVQAIEESLVWARMELPEETTALFREYPANAQGRNATSVEGMLLRMMEAAGANPKGASAFALPESRVNPALILDHVAAAIDEAREAALQEKPGKKRDEWLDGIEHPYAAIREALETGMDDSLEVLRLLAPVKFSKGFGSAEYKAIVDDARLVLSGGVMELRLHAAQPHLRTLIAIARNAYGRFVHAKREAGALDNNDLLTLAYRALVDNPRIAARYADAFKLIMVDEFQDTDQLQVDMVKCLAGPGFTRLCTVGDAQQSIYRFRGADVAVYRRHVAAVKQGDSAGVIELHDNFRSHGDVLAYVRRVFERPEMFGGSFMNLEHGREDDQVKRPFTGLGPRVSILHTCVPYRGAVPGAGLQTAARRIAARFAQLRDAGYPASDMVVLLGVMKNAGVYAQALRDAGLPCVITGGTVFPSSVEALTVLDAVRVLADPHDACALYRLMAGPLFELSENDLLQLATRADDDGAPRRRDLDQGLFSLMREDAPFIDSARLSCAVRVLSDALRGVGTASVEQLVRRMVVDAGWLSRLEKQGPEGLAGAGNVLKALRLLKDEEALGGFGPAQLAQRFAELLDGLKEGPGALSAGEGDFVRIMTVHASKGLEFPVVALADLGSGGSSGKFLLEDVGGRIYVSLDLGRTGTSIGGGADLESAAAREALASMFDEGADEDDLACALEQSDDALTRRAALALRNDVGEEEERKRLLYVALTRAREALVISLGGTFSGKNPFGIPSTVLGETVRALGYGEGDLPADRASYDFGGEQPAIVERVALEPGQSADEAFETARRADGPTEGAQEFAAAPTVRMHIERVPFRAVRRGVFSYSSIAEASHEGDLLEELAREYAIGDYAAAEDDATAVEQLAEVDSGSSFADAFWDEASWEVPVPHAAFSADTDKATDLGTAFHRLAQYAVVAREDNTMLAMPPSERVDALARTCALGDGARKRLRAALERWFESDMVASLASCDNLRAEVPFFVRIESDGEADTRYLEGEIDLLALSDDKRQARVIDYKTGGSSEETASALGRKHVLQAACYAYALMRSGVEHVEAFFVRVERPDPRAPGQPQIVPYAFSVEDIDALERAIVRAADLGMV